MWRWTLKRRKYRKKKCLCRHGICWWWTMMNSFAGMWCIPWMNLAFTPNTHWTERPRCGWRKSGTEKAGVITLFFWTGRCRESAAWRQQRKCGGKSGIIFRFCWFRLTTGLILRKRRKRRASAVLYPNLCSNPHCITDWSRIRVLNVKERNLWRRKRTLAEYAFWWRRIMILTGRLQMNYCPQEDLSWSGRKTAASA